jgi:hypothetical protein
MRYVLLSAVCVVTATLVGCGGTPSSPAAVTTTTSTNVTAEPSSGRTVVPTGFDFSREYTLSITADPACTDLPPAYLSKTFSVTFGPSTVIVGEVGRITTEGMEPNYNSFFVRGYSDGMKVGLYSQYAVEAWLEEDPLIQRLGPREHYSILGNGSVPFLQAGKTSGEWSGVITYCSADEPPRQPTWASTCPVAATARCESTHHRLAFTEQ